MRAALTWSSSADRSRAPLGIVNRDLPERAVLGGGRPVLVVPFAGRFDTLGRHVLAAWNDSREAARSPTRCRSCSGRIR